MRLRQVCLALLGGSLAFFLCLEVFSAPAEDKSVICRIAHGDVYQELLSEIDALENAFLHYRWLESKIRLITYDDLWRARTQSLNPLSPEERRSGETEESRILEVLKGFDERALESSNGFHQKIRAIQGMDANFMECCPDKRFKECVESAFTPLYETMDETLKLFDHVFEHEREYRKEVDTVVAGRSGLYAEDALEGKAQHKPYFWRFELPRRQARFEEDEPMMRFLERAREQSRTIFSGSDCCYSCGRTDWQKKTGKIVSEVLSTEKSKLK